VVLKWETPEGEMVAYRSFQPFFSLLRSETPYQVQLWAVWAIQHVCTKNCKDSEFLTLQMFNCDCIAAKRYCPMLIEEGGDLKMRVLAEGAETNLAVKTICNSIMEVLENETAPCPMQVENV
jgi:Zyg-11 protein homolog